MTNVKGSIGAANFNSGTTCPPPVPALICLSLCRRWSSARCPCRRASRSSVAHSNFTTHKCSITALTWPTGFLLRRCFQQRRSSSWVWWRISSSKWPIVWVLAWILRLKPADKRSSQAFTASPTIRNCCGEEPIGQSSLSSHLPSTTSRLRKPLKKMRCSRRCHHIINELALCHKSGNLSLCWLL